MKVMWTSLALVLFCVGCGTTAPTARDVKLHGLFGDHMVLQRDMPIAVYGTAGAAGTVNVTLQARIPEAHWTRQARVDERGNWRVELPGQNAGGPYTLTVAGADRALTLHNVMIGEVWICSGQSNMEMELKDVVDAPAVTAAANHPNIRLYTQPHTNADAPVADAHGSWVACTPQSVKEFSAVAYFFGRDLHKQLNVPIGLIESAWGGSAAEAWTTRRTLLAHEELSPIVKRNELIAKSFPEAWRQFDVALKKWQKEHPEWRDSFQHDAGNLGLGWGWAKPEFADSDWKEIFLPRGLTGVIDANGAFWFRKEIDIPAAWAGKELELTLGAIDDHDTTYFNGRQVGATGDDGAQTYFLPRKYKVPGSLVKAGKAVLAVRVFDQYLGGGFTGSPEDMKLSLDDKHSLSLAGAWKYKVETALDPGKLKPWPLGMPSPPSLVPTIVGGMYNGMMHPLLGYGFRGVIWYQGESNGDRGWQYRTLLPAMIGDWRKGAGRDFAFLIVQLPSFGNDWSELREAQAITARDVRRCGLAVTLDIVDYDLHPRIKEPVGQRLALQALARVYDQKVVASGPVYRKMKIEGNKIRLYFDLDKGARLVQTSRGDTLHNFVIAGDSRKFLPAQAVIDGDTVLVWSDQVPHPAAARYAWSNIVPDCDFYSSNEFRLIRLPAGTFRTDDWPLESAGKR